MYADTFKDATGDGTTGATCEDGETVNLTVEREIGPSTVSLTLALTARDAKRLADRLYMYAEGI